MLKKLLLLFFFWLCYIIKMKLLIIHTAAICVIQSLAFFGQKLGIMIKLFLCWTFFWASVVMLFQVKKKILKQAPSQFSLIYLDLCLWLTLFHYLNVSQKQYFVCRCLCRRIIGKYLITVPSPSCELYMKHNWDVFTCKSRRTVLSSRSLVPCKWVRFLFWGCSIKVMRQHKL